MKMKKYKKPEFEEKLILSEEVLSTAPLADLFDKYGVKSTSGITSYQYTSNYIVSSSGETVAELVAD
jgi:hypothetical protein